ncbi:MAG: SpoIID/LytB domain-containing protein [Jatrophihabitans sp.]
MNRLAAPVGLALAALVALSAVPTAGAAPSKAPSSGPSAAQPKIAAAAVAGEVIVKDTTPGHPSCTGFSSQTTPPSSIRVLITSGTPRIAVVPFEQYVENVLPNEWIRSWSAESLNAGAVAVKAYAWFWVNHFGGYLKTRSTCFDVTDDTAFQVYRAGSADDRTNAAVQQTWSVIARDTSHQVRQAFYICSLPFKSGTTNCGTQGPKEKCGASANGLQLSQYGSQACAVAGLDYQSILRKYYSPNLELVSVTLGPVSHLPAGPVQLASTGVLAAYRVSGSNLLGSTQSAKGGTFGKWSVLNAGPSLTGVPAALVATSGVLAVYVRSIAGQILGDGQSHPGGAFTGWRVIGTGSPRVLSDPTPMLAANGAIVIYAIASDGNVWGTGQSRPGSTFSAWKKLSATGGFTGKPAAAVTAAHQIVIYARHGSAIRGSGQFVAGGTFSAFADIGSGTANATGDPNVVQAGDGTLTVFSAGTPTKAAAIWAAGQASPGSRFGAWRQISTAATFVSAPAAHAMTSTGPIVVYAVSAKNVYGAQVATPGSTFSAFRTIGIGSPGAIGNPAIMIAASGALGLYVIGTGGALWGCGQSAPGSGYGAWVRIGG